MKNTHVFEFLGKKRTLYKRAKGGAAPTAATPWSCRMTVGGKRVLISTRTAALDMAVRIAKAKFQAAVGAKVEPVIAPKGKVPTFAELKPVYIDAKVVREQTAASNWRALVSIVRGGLGREEIDGMKIDVISGDLVKAWLVSYLGKDPDYSTVGKRNISANSMLRMAKSVFARRHAHIYDGLRIPAGVEELLKFKLLKTGSPRYVPLPHGILRQIDEAAAELTADLRMVYQLIRLCGLRDSEVEAVKTSWVLEHGGRLFIDVVTRPDEFVPKGHEGRIAIPKVMEPAVRKLLKSAGSKPVHLVLPNAKKTARHDLIYRQHSKWLRQFMPEDRRKTNHELRKAAGSLVAAKFNSWEAAARFLREDLATAKKHYLELLHPVGLEAEDLALSG